MREKGNIGSLVVERREETVIKPMLNVTTASSVMVVFFLVRLEQCGLLQVLAPFTLINLPFCGTYSFHLSDYKDTERYFLMSIGIRCGLVYSPILTQEITFFICPSSTAYNYENALKLNVEVINHVWLEVSFRDWMFHKTSRQRYIVTEHQIQQVGLTRINQSITKLWWDPTCAKPKEKSLPKKKWFHYFNKHHINFSEEEIKKHKIAGETEIIKIIEKQKSSNKKDKKGKQQSLATSSVASSSVLIQSRAAAKSERDFLENITSSSNPSVSASTISSKDKSSVSKTTKKT